MTYKINKNKKRLKYKIEKIFICPKCELKMEFSMVYDDYYCKHSDCENKKRFNFNGYEIK